MNRIGVIVDVAHCSEDTVRGVVAAASKPILCTHANLREPGVPDGEHPRFISPEYARMVVETGGVIGAWLSTLTREKVPGMIRHMFRAIDAVGIDHVGIGTDLPAGVAQNRDAEFRPPPGTGGGVARSRHDRGRGRESVLRQLVAGVPGGARLMDLDALETEGRLRRRRDGRGRDAGRIWAPARPPPMRSAGWGNSSARGCGSPACRRRRRAPNWRARSGFR